MYIIKKLLAGPFLLMMVLVTGVISPAIAQGDARARFVHVIPGATAVDVYINGTLAISDLAYGEASTYLAAPAGNHTVAVTPTGIQSLLWEQTITLEAERAVTFLASDPASLSFGSFEDDLTGLPVGTGRLLLVHGIAAGPTVNVELAEDVELNGVVQAAGTVLAGGMAYGNTFGTFDLPAQSYPVNVLTETGEAILENVPVPVSSGTTHIALVYGTAQAPEVMLLTAPVQSGESTGLVRFVHGIPDAPAVDVYLNDILIIPELSVDRPTEHIALTSGEGNLVVRAAGTEDELFNGPITIEADSAQTAVALSGDEGVQVAVFTDNVIGITPETALVSVINTVPGALLQELTFGAETTLAELVESGQASAAAPVSPATERSSFTLARGDQSGTLQNDATTLYGGVYYNVIVLDGGAFSAPRLIFAPTSLQQQIASAPGDADITLAGGGATGTTDTTGGATTDGTASDAAAAPTPVPDTVAAQPTPADAAPAAQPTNPPALPPVVQGPQEIVGRIELDPGVNLQLRQYPSNDALSLGLVPSGTIVTVNGREGAPVALVEGQPAPPEAADFVDPADFLVDDFADLIPEETWLNITYETPDGGQITAWVNGLYVTVSTSAGEPYRLAELEMIGGNIPGESVSTEVTPPPLPEDNVTGIISGLDPGVNLNIRRTPERTGEVLARLTNGTTVDIQGFTETNDWSFISYQPAEGGTVTGWVSTLYLDVYLNDELVTIAGLIDTFEQYTNEPLYVVIPSDTRGEVTGDTLEVSVPTPDPLENVIVAEVVGINQGNNLQLRRNPDANSESVNLIPPGTRLIVDGRNGTGDWLSVTFEGESGWVVADFTSLSLNDEFIDIVDVPLVPGETEGIGLPPGS